MQGAPPDTSSIDRILVLQLCPIGDTLFGTPAIRALRRRFPRAYIADVTWSANREVLEGNPHLDRVILCRSGLQLPRLLSALADEDFDAVVGLSNIGSWLSLFTRATVRVGFNSQTLGWFYSSPVPDRRERHAIDYCLDVVAALGAEPDGRRMDLPVGPADRAWARRLLTASAQAAPLRVAIHPGGRHFPAKRWPASGFAHVADYLVGQYGAQVVVVGGPDDVKLARVLAEEARLAEPLVVAGRTSLKQTAAILEQCDVFIGNDSSPLHMAQAVGTPVVALFGPTDPGNFGPQGPYDVVVRRAVPCSPCFHWLGGSRQYLSYASLVEQPAPCMRAIGPADVIAAVEQVLDRTALREARRLPKPPPLLLPEAPPWHWSVEGETTRLPRGPLCAPGVWRRRASGRRKASLTYRRRMAHKVQEFEEM